MIAPQLHTLAARAKAGMDAATLHILPVFLSNQGAILPTVATVGLAAGAGLLRNCCPIEQMRVDR